MQRDMIDKLKTRFRNEMSGLTVAIAISRHTWKKRKMQKHSSILIITPPSSRHNPFQADHKG
jgi:hypothetical protein